jgi:hypothetical protein
MIKGPSNQKPYEAVWTGDGAFIQLPKDATEEQQEEHARKWEVARETNDYSALRLEGADDPTVFALRHLTADQLTYLHGATKAGTLTPVESTVLAFRAALLDVRNVGKVKIGRIHHKRLGEIATLDFFDKAGIPAGMAVAVATQLGNLVVAKASPSPKS